jgi:hypothetical protein
VSDSYDGASNQESTWYISHRSVEYCCEITGIAASPLLSFFIFGQVLSQRHAAKVAQHVNFHSALFRFGGQVRGCIPDRERLLQRRWPFSRRPGSWPATFGRKYTDYDRESAIAEMTTPVKRSTEKSSEDIVPVWKLKWRAMDMRQ